MFESWFGQREPMSRVDTAWLRMERPTNLMMITGVIVLEKHLTLERLRALIADRFLEFPRFRQRAMDLGGQSYWEVDRDFDLSWHVRRSALPGGAGKPELQEFVSQLGSTPLDHSKPLWQFHLVENYIDGPALVSRIHHCYADGLALVQVLLSLTDEHPDDHTAAIKHKLRKEGGTVFQRLLEPARAGFSQAAGIGSKAWEKLLGFVTHPQTLLDTARSGATEVSEIASELVTAVTLPDDPHTLFKGPLGVSKRVAWCAPIPIEDVKAVGRAFDCTLNDVLMAAVAGALRAYLIERGENPDGKTIRATVPVNLRPLEHARQLGNHFGLVYLDLPIGEANPLTRLYRVRDCMRKLKGSRQAVVSYGLLGAIGMAPASLQKSALEMFSKKATAVATNVPGPAHPLYLAGVRIKELMFWVPQTGTIGMGISILSYSGAVYFGLITDKKNVPAPDAIIERFAPELEKLLMIALMGDWEGKVEPEDAESTLAHFTGAASKTRPKATRRKVQRATRPTKPAVNS